MTTEANLEGRVCVVTGASAGLGRQTALDLARMGATVILACRTPERGRLARDAIVREAVGARVDVMELDLSRLSSVRAFAEAVRARHPAIDVLVNNAAEILHERRTSADGFERQWATNVLGPWLLTQRLLPALVASERGRIVNVASKVAGGLDLADTQCEKRPYKGMGQYAATKQANRMLTWALARRLEGRRVTANAVHPGFTQSELNRHAPVAFQVALFLSRPFQLSTRAGADTQTWLASSPEVEGRTGGFWMKRREVPCEFRQPGADIEALWQLCEKQAGEPPS